MESMLELWPIYSLAFAVLAVNVIFAYAIYATLATGLLSFAAIGFGAAGGFLAARLAFAGVALPLALLAGAAAGLLSALAFAAAALRLQPGQGLLASLALVLLIHALGRYAPASLGPSVVGPAGTLAMPMAIGLAALVVLGFRGLHRSWHGVAARVLRRDPAMAGSMGIVAGRVRLIGFAAAGLAAGLGGAMLALSLRAVSAETYSLQLLFLAAAGAVLGGADHWSGPLLGTILVWALALLGRLVAPGLDDVAVALALALTLLFRPGGLTEAPVAAAALTRPRRVRLRGLTPPPQRRYHRVDR